MLKQRKLTSQELLKAKKDKEDQEKDVYLPPGLVNHGNTCFMNSVLQGLIATRDLYDLVHFSPLPRSFQTASSRPILYKRSPQLTNGHILGGGFNQERVEGMPLGDIFIDFLHVAWSVQDERQRANLSPQDILVILGRKYDQYLDFRQQDAHEFLRLLLDAMRMEELDIIKKRQPPPPKEKKRKQERIRSPRKTPLTLTSVPPEIDEVDKLESFVDMLFGGKLASFLVCEKCKHISHTYEDFNDLSLSIKPEDFVKERKRDRLKALAKKFGLGQWEETHPESPGSPRSSSVPPSPTRKSFDTASDDVPISSDPRRRSHELVPSELKNMAVIGDSEGNIDAEIATKDKETFLHVGSIEPDRAKEGKEDDSWVKLGKRISKSVGKKGMGRPRGRDSSSKTGKPKPRDESTTSLVPSGPTLNGGDFVEVTLPFSPSTSPDPSSIPDLGAVSNSFALPISSPTPIRSNKRIKSPLPPKLSHDEAAYLRHILADVAPTLAHQFGIFRPGSAPAFPNGSSTPSTSHNLWTKLSQLPGIEECLRWFTSVELLEGDNMVGCRKCWKIANGMCKDRLVNEDHSESEESEEAHTLISSPAFTSGASSPHSAVSSGFVSAQSSPDLDSDSSPAPALTPFITDEPSSRNSDNDSSATSLPTTVEPIRPMQAPLPMALDLKSLLPSATNSPDPNSSTYVGLPIPIISTTAPESPITPPLTSHTIIPNSAYSLTPTSLSAPGMTRRRLPHKPNRDSGNLSEVSSDSFDKTESEASFSETSSLVSPLVSPNASQDQLHIKSPPGPASQSPSSMVPRSKQVIMRRCYKRYLISEPPPVLVIHLKRFQQTSKNLMSFSTGFKKLDDYVTFPELLDLTPFIAPKKEDFGLGKNSKEVKQKSVQVRYMYRLFAVVVHIGNMLGGHYITYTALSNANPHSAAATSASEPAQPTDTPATNKGGPTFRRWAYISDTSVKLTTLEEVLKSKAYICMYERIS